MQRSHTIGRGNASLLTMEKCDDRTCRGGDKPEVQRESFKRLRMMYLLGGEGGGPGDAAGRGEVAWWGGA